LKIEEDSFLMTFGLILFGIGVAANIAFWIAVIVETHRMGLWNVKNFLTR
jgi:hypothetical protein